MSYATTSSRKATRRSRNGVKPEVTVATSENDVNSHHATTHNVGNVAAMVFASAACVGAGLVRHFWRQQQSLQVELIATQSQLSEISIELEGTKQELRDRSADLEATVAQLETHTAELAQHRAALEQSQGELGLTRSQLGVLQQELHATRRNLLSYQSQLERARCDLETTRTGRSPGGGMWGV